MNILRFLPLIGITLAVSATAQTQIPTLVQPERAIGVPATTDNPFPGSSSSVASNGEDFLVVTSQDRIYGGNAHAVMMVGADGQPVLASSGLFFGAGNVDGVASNGHDFLVVFGGLGGTSAVRVSADGTMDSTPFGIHGSTRAQFSAHDMSGSRSVVWDGSQYIVLTTIEKETVSSYEASDIVTRVGVDGRILQNDILVNDRPGDVLAARNGVTVIAWAGREGVLARTMTSGALLGASQINAAGGSVSIADGDDGFLVVWAEGASKAIRARHLDPGGLPDAPAFTVSVASGADPLAVTWDGTGYRVAWQNAASRAIESIRVNATAAVEASAVTLADGGKAALASNGASTLLVWSDADYYTRVRGAESAGAGRFVHRFFNAQSLNAIGFTPAGPSVAWNEGGSRLTNVSSGASSLPISDGTYTFIRGLNRPLIISGYAAPFTARYADGAGLPFALPTKNPFWSGSGFLCLWTDPAPVTNPFVILPLYAQRFDANGAAIDAAPRQIGTSFSLSENFTGAAALYNGVFAGASASETLVAYVDPGAALHGVLIVDNQFIDIGEMASRQALANPIAITSDGHDFLVTWISGMKGTNSFIASRRVLADGSMPAASRIDSPGDDRKDSLETFWTGQNYLVVWSKLPEPTSHDHELWALRLRQDGTLIDYPPQRIGSISGEVPKWAYQNGALAIAWQRDSRVYSMIGVPRRRAVAQP